MAELEKRLPEDGKAETATAQRSVETASMFCLHPTIIAFAGGGCGCC